MSIAPNKQLLIVFHIYFHSRSFTLAAQKLSHSLSNAALGDDDGVRDRWETVASFKENGPQKCKTDSDNKVWPSDKERTSTVRDYLTNP